MRRYMNNLKKQVLSFSLLFMMVAFLLPASALAASQEQTNPDTGYSAVIRDDADLLEDASAVMRTMYNVTEFCNVAYVSTRDNYYMTAKEYAEQKYYELFGNASGVLFLIDMSNRQIYIASDGAAYKIINRSAAYTITDNVYTYASKADYDGCVIETFEEVNTLLTGGRVAEPMRIVCALIMAFCLSLIVTFMIAKKSSVRGTFSADEAFNHVLENQHMGQVTRRCISRKTHRVERSGGGGGGFSGGGGGGFGGGGGGFSGGGGGHGF